MVVLMIDADNLSAPAWIDEACQAIQKVEGSISVRRAYGSADNLRGLADVCGRWAIRPFSNLSLSKNTTDMALAVDLMELACLHPAPKVVYLGSGDADFVPLVVRLRERGIRMVCVSERSKMSQEAVPAYDQMLLLGTSAPVALAAAAPRPAPARKSAPRKASAKPVATSPPPAREAPARAAAPKAPAARRANEARPPVTAQQILDVLPELRNGRTLPLGEVTHALRSADLLGRTAASTKLLGRFPEDFELSPTRQPNQVRYRG